MSASKRTSKNAKRQKRKTAKKVASNKPKSERLFFRLNPKLEAQMPDVMTEDEFAKHLVFFAACSADTEDEIGACAYGLAVVALEKEVPLELMEEIKHYAHRAAQVQM